MILQLVSVLSHCKVAKRLTDRAIDLMQGVHNLREAIYEYASFDARSRSAPNNDPFIGHYSGSGSCYFTVMVHRRLVDNNLVGDIDDVLAVQVLVSRGIALAPLNMNG